MKHNNLLQDQKLKERTQVFLDKQSKKAEEEFVSRKKDHDSNRKSFF